jgi:rRNA maturation protein Nop10
MKKMSPQGLSEKCQKSGSQVALPRSEPGNSFRKMRKEARRMRALPIFQTGSQEPNAAITECDDLISIFVSSTRTAHGGC